MQRPYSSADPYETFECLVVRLVGRPMLRARGGAFVFADVDLPEKYRSLAGRSWNPDGTCRVEVPVMQNRKSLAAFLASGDEEWDVRGIL